jgi:hypothetical protein
MVSAVRLTPLCLALGWKRFHRSAPHDCRPFGALLFWGFLLLVAGSAQSAIAAGPQSPDWRTYTVPFLETFPPVPPPSNATLDQIFGKKMRAPPTGDAAVATTRLRAKSIIRHFACGLENEFLSLAANPHRSADRVNNTYVPSYDDGLLHMVMAKLVWLKMGNGDCSGSFRVALNHGDESDFFADPNNTQFFNSHDSFVDLYRKTFPTACENASFWGPALGQPRPINNFFVIQATVPADCLKAQIETVLFAAQKGDQEDKQPGTDGLPCNIFSVDFSGVHIISFANGDWDFSMKTLIRILFLDLKAAGEKNQQLLSDKVRRHILYELISVSGGPSPDSYSWTSCGDNEDDTSAAQAQDPAQDLEDENSNADDFFDSVGDILSWFLRRLAFFAVFGSNFYPVPPPLAALTLYEAVPEFANAVVDLGVPVTLLAQLPETENHRLMIESSRFLKNQLVIQDLQARQGDASNLIGEQDDVKSWLPQDFQRIAKGDFTEYNARPYYRFAHEALRNLADFATDADVRTGAQMLIEYSAAKFAVGSNQGRRLAPFRRHFGVVACLDGNPCHDEHGDDVNVPVEIFRGFSRVLAIAG